MTVAGEIKNFVRVTDAMLRNPDPGDWLMARRTYQDCAYRAGKLLGLSLEEIALLLQHDLPPEQIRSTVKIVADELANIAKRQSLMERATLAVVAR